MGSEAVGHLNRTLLRRTNHTRSDIRIVSGEIINEKAFPRQSVPAQWWQWKEVFSKTLDSSWPYKLFGTWGNTCGNQVSNSMFWGLRHEDLPGFWFFRKHCIEGRSSSWRLQRVMNQISARLLSHGLQLIIAHVESTENLTDKGSRKWWWRNSSQGAFLKMKEHASELR